MNKVEKMPTLKQLAPALHKFFGTSDKSKTRALHVKADTQELRDMETSYVSRIQDGCIGKMMRQLFRARWMEWSPFKMGYFCGLMVQRDTTEELIRELRAWMSLRPEMDRTGLRKELRGIITRYHNKQEAKS